MQAQAPASPTLKHALEGQFLRFAASGWVPARWFEPNLPKVSDRAERRGALSLEIVSHCWNYSHFLVYQLSSLVLFPPQATTVTMTVFYNAQDRKTSDLLAYFGSKQVANVCWNWRELTQPELFRRAIGRNIAAKETSADWIWFTDCDLLFREDCLDALGHQLQGRRDALVYPSKERVTSLLASQDPMLTAGEDKPQLMDIDATYFIELPRTRATGPLQITHGDVARACGYCNALTYYQQPAASWCKAYEDRAFRWLLRTQGTALDIPGVYRIRHADKGRYTGSTFNTGLRGRLRRWQSRRIDRHSKRGNHGE